LAGFQNGCGRWLCGGAKKCQGWGEWLTWLWWVACFRRFVAAVLWLGVRDVIGKVVWLWGRVGPVCEG